MYQKIENIISKRFVLGYRTISNKPSVVVCSLKS